MTTSGTRWESGQLARKFKATGSDGMGMFKDAIMIIVGKLLNKSISKANDDEDDH